MPHWTTLPLAVLLGVTLHPMYVMLAQWISYTREYFQTADRRIRITVDRELRACDQRFRTDLSARFPTPIPRLLVVELKAGREDYPALRDFASTFSLLQDKCSKFVIASSPKDAPTISVLTD